MDTPDRATDLPTLEKAYAENPFGDAFVPLSQAYLAQGRLMEAMVVCRKGIKNQPDNLMGRLLLARVYAEQGKVPKALDEVKALLLTVPDAAEAHFFHAQMLDKNGKTDEAIEAYKETLRNDRGHSHAARELKAKGIDWSPGPSPQELAEAAAAEALRVAQEAEQNAAAARAAQQAAQAAQAVGMRAPRSRTPGAEPGAPRPAAQAWSNDPALQGYAGAYGYVSGPVPAMGSGRRLGPGFTFGLGALLLLFVVGFGFALKINKAKKEEIAEHLKAAQKGVLTDTTGGHRLAIRELDAALKVDDSQALAAGQRALSLSLLAVDRGEKELDAEAKKATERASKVAPSQPGTVAAEMIQLRAEGKGAAAIAIADTLRGSADVSALPVAVRIQLGRAYVALGRIDDATKLAESMKDLPDAGALTFVGDVYRRIGDLARARMALDNAMKSQLDHDPARALRALSILEADDATNLGVALDDLRSLKDLGKDAVGTKQRGYASLGMAMAGARIGRPDKDNEVEAQNARTLLRSDPELPLFDAKKALADKDYKKAIELCQGAIGLDKVRLEPYLTLVEAATRASDWGAADKALADAAAVFGDNLELGLAKAGRLRDNDRADDATAALQSLLAKFDVAEVHRDIGKALLKKGDFPGAVASLKKAGEKASNRAPGVKANVFMWLGRALAAAGDDEQAVGAYSEALAATSEYATTYFFLASSLKKTGKNDAAREAIQKYLKADPNGQYVAKAKELLQDL